MRISIITPPMIYTARWLREYATALIAIGLVALATLGVGIAQTLYSNVAPHAIISGAGATAPTALDQHERHGFTFAR